jgi:hypothetical protein
MGAAVARKNERAAAATSPAPVQNLEVRSMPELIAALRARRDELQITHETIDAIAGWPAGYAGKLLAPEPIKNLGWMSLGLALDTLGIALVVVENKEQRKLVEGRWKQRERPHQLPTQTASTPGPTSRHRQVTPRR